MPEVPRLNPALGEQAMFRDRAFQITQSLDLGDPLLCELRTEVVECPELKKREQSDGRYQNQKKAECCI
jgi:hypothetical protein